MKIEKGGILPQLRQNIITGDWVVIAPERAKRPSDFISADTVRHQSRTKCAFCIGKSAWKERLKKYDSKNIYTCPNKFPAFVEESKKCSARSYQVENNFYRARASVGGHDVVVVKDHDMDLPRFSRQIWEEMLLAFQTRYHYFEDKCNSSYTMPIYNHQVEGGASIEHPHAQIFSSNIIPNLIVKELHHTEKYFEHNGKCAFCDLIAHEKKEKIRVIDENCDFVAFCFYAARFPFEIWILPKDHASKFENIPRTNIVSLAKCLIEVFAKLDQTLNDPPLNFFIHSLPHTITQADYYHWHLEIAPRIQGYGGYELGSGNIIDVVSPERAAEFLLEK